MGKIFLKLVFILIFFLIGIYLSLPWIIEKGFYVFSRNAPYQIIVHGLKNNLPHVEIDSIDLIHKETQDKIILSKIDFMLSFEKILKGKIRCQDITIKKISKKDIEIQNVTGSLDVKYNTFRLSARFDQKFQESFNYEQGMINLKLKKDNRLHGDLILTNMNVYGRSLGNVMASAQGIYKGGANIEAGELDVLSPAVNIKGNFNILEDTLYYQFFAQSSLFNFLGKHKLHFEGKYDLFKNQVHASLQSHFYNEGNLKVLGTLQGDSLSSLEFIPESINVYDQSLKFPQKKDRLSLSFVPFSLQGNVNFFIQSFDQIGEVFLAKSKESFLKINGDFKKEDYYLSLEGKQLLLWALFKASDLNILLKGKKDKGTLEIALLNKEKTNLKFKTNYHLNDEGCTFTQSDIQGNYRGTVIKTVNAKAYMPFNDGFLDAQMNIHVGPRGKILLKNAKQEFSIDSENIPIVMLNNLIKNQNIIFSEGMVDVKGSYLPDFLNLKVNMLGVKSSIFENTIGNAFIHAHFKDGVFKSDLKSNWGQSSYFSGNYTTKNCPLLSFDHLYSFENTSFQAQGNVIIDGFSDFLQMYDDTLSGNMKIQSEKKEKEMFSMDIILDQGYLNHAFFGMEIKGIRAQVKKKATHDDIDFLLQGNDGEQGEIAVQGKFSSTKNLGTGKMDLRLFKILNLEKYQGTGTGRLTLDFSPKEKKISGVININNFLGYMVPGKETQIIDIKIPLKSPSQPSYDAPEEVALSNVILDVRLSSKGNALRFYGSGLESFWNGNLHLVGALSNPRLNGRLDASSGYFVFAGKKLPFLEGYLSFKNEIDPTIYVSADANATNIDARIIYHGSLSNPALDLLSTPILPKEEILSQIMFSKSASQVKSPAQIIQLTDALAIFTGKGMSLTGLLDKFRQISGIDEIGIREDAINSLFLSPLSSPDPGVFSVVKNLGSNLFIRGERTLSGSTPDSKTRGIVGIKLIPDLSLELIGEKPDQSSTSTDSFDFGIGFEWKKDF